MFNWRTWLRFSRPRGRRRVTRPGVFLSVRRSRPALEALDARIVPAGGVSSTYAVTQDWVSGFQAQMTLNNTQATAVANWKLEFDLQASISSIWDAKILSHVGNHYVIGGA